MSLDSFLQAEIDLGSFPGASYAIGSSRRLERSGALGHAIVLPLRLPATTQTLYDCASITKPLITTTLILQAVAEGLLDLEQEFHGFPIRRLLTHTSGLRAWMPLYATDDYLRAILEEGRQYEPGSQVVYSDLNFILLYLLLQRTLGDYVEAARRRIFEPLRIEAMFNPSPRLRPRIAATELGQRFEARLANRFDIPGARQGLMWGETNDGNSFHNGGTAGNAGLFATAESVYAIARGWLDGTLVPPSLFDLATRNHTAGLNEERGLGWQLRSDDNRATRMLSDGSFGHTGFTGTSVWIDRARDRVMVLLTNRVHPCAAPIAMQQIRGKFHALALE